MHAPSLLLEQGAVANMTQLQECVFSTTLLNSYGDSVYATQHMRW